MTDNKDTDPTLTPEWFASLLSRPSMKGTSAEMGGRAIPRDTEGNPLPEAPGHRKELEEGLPVPVIDEFGTMSIECVKAIGTLIEGAADEPEDCAGIPVIPPNEMGDADIPACVEDAKALQGAYEVEMSEDEYEAFCARARGESKEDQRGD